MNQFNDLIAQQIKGVDANGGKFTTMQRKQVVEMVSRMPNFTEEPEESSWPRLEVQELSSYQQDNTMDESTFRQMSVPQGPGTAMKFLGSMGTEENTCFTANFQQELTTTQQTVMQTQQSNIWSHSGFSTQEKQSVENPEEESTQPAGNLKDVHRQDYTRHESSKTALESHLISSMSS